MQSCSIEENSQQDTCLYGLSTLILHIPNFHPTNTSSTMPSFTSSSAPPKRDLPAFLDAARPFLRGELDLVDPALPHLVSVLRSVGAAECWHKHGTFLDHLTDVFRILTLWSAPAAVALCGLYHSAYSNSYVNLAIFEPDVGRDKVRKLIGGDAERLVHLFCIVPRQPLIHDDLLFRYADDDDAEIVKHLAESEFSLCRAREEGVFDPEEAWRRKLNSVLPPGGVTVKHIRTGEEVAVSRRVVATFLLMTMADFSDQLFGFQDAMFRNYNGRLEFAGNDMGALWPGDGKPGLWMNSVSRMAAVYTLIAREEEIYLEERKRSNGVSSHERDEDIELVIPPVFEYCTKVLDAKEQIVARDRYWEAVCGHNVETAEELLLGSIESNRFVGEPRLVLAQVYLAAARYEEAEREAENGLRLVLEWGSCWDKRMSWEGWVAWGRVLLMKARERSWPNNAWGVLNLGLVK